MRKGLSAVIISTVTFLNLLAGSARAVPQSSRDEGVTNNLNTAFILTSLNYAQGISVTASSGNTTDPTSMPAGTSKNVLHISGNYEQNITVKFSYRDQVTQTFGCDF